jgi:hypothetical protein
MKKIFLYILLSLSFLNSIEAQKNIPVIKANVNLVDIKDGNNFQKGSWTIVPEAKPDVFSTSSKEVFFYTDIDSIKIKVKQDVNWKFDFIVLLNGKDSAYTQVQYRPSYLSILKTAKNYNNTTSTGSPKFEYQPMDNPRLVKIRQELKLDSIAGTGNEVSKIINLMHWIHFLIPHDGQHANPEVRNALNMISECKKEGRGLNCRGLATVLNECYLSLGIKSRFVTCLPKDTSDPDCHVINMVFSNDLNKWIWIDPTMDAYVMNEKGDLLGIEEVRERLINGKPLILNPDANWNRQQSQKKEHYLENYMAKNLYRIECPLVSEYNTETVEKGKVITYVQLSSIVDIPQKNVYPTYFTHNPKFFWAKPE